MSRPKKDGKALNIKLNMTTYENLEQYCEESGLTKTRAVERFLDKCLDEYFSKTESERKLN